MVTSKAKGKDSDTVSQCVYYFGFSFLSHRFEYVFFFVVKMMDGLLCIKKKWSYMRLKNFFSYMSANSIMTRLYETTPYSSFSVEVCWSTWYINIYIYHSTVTDWYSLSIEARASSQVMNEWFELDHIVCAAKKKIHNSAVDNSFFHVQNFGRPLRSMEVSDLLQYSMIQYATHELWRWKWWNKCTSQPFG